MRECSEAGCTSMFASSLLTKPKKPSMKKVIVMFVGILAFAVGSFAQQGEFKLSPAVEVGLPTGDAGDANKLILGLTVKGLYGISESGQVSFTTGLLTSGAKNEYKDLLGADKITSTMIPLLAGYRHSFNGFFAEPQIGYGIYGVKVKGGAYDSKDSQGAFTWAAGVGYVFNSFEAGLRYQSMHKDGASSGFFGLRLGYIIPLAGSK